MDKSVENNDMSVTKKSDQGRGGLRLARRLVPQWNLQRTFQMKWFQMNWVVALAIVVSSTSVPQVSFAEGEEPRQRRSLLYYMFVAPDEALANLYNWATRKKPGQSGVDQARSSSSPAANRVRGAQGSARAQDTSADTALPSGEGANPPGRSSSFLGRLFGSSEASPVVEEVQTHRHWLDLGTLYRSNPSGLDESRHPSWIREFMRRNSLVSVDPILAPSSQRFVDTSLVPNLISERTNDPIFVQAQDGSGATTLALGLARTLSQQGLEVFIPNINILASQKASVDGESATESTVVGAISELTSFVESNRSGLPVVVLLDNLKRYENSAYLPFLESLMSQVEQGKVRLVSTMSTSFFDTRSVLFDPNRAKSTADKTMEKISKDTANPIEGLFTKLHEKDIKPLSYEGPASAEIKTILKRIFDADQFRTRTVRGQKFDIVVSEESLSTLLSYADNLGVRSSSIRTLLKVVETAINKGLAREAGGPERTVALSPFDLRSALGEVLGVPKVFYEGIKSSEDLFFAKTDFEQELTAYLLQEVRGQDRAVAELSKIVTNHYFNFDKIKKPAVIKLHGSSGVGKNFTFQKISEFIFKRTYVLFAFNSASDAQTAGTAIKGAAPGFIGYGEGGLVTNAFKKISRWLVLFLDEIEKVRDPGIGDHFLQAKSDGYLIDGQGDVVEILGLVVEASNIAKDYVRVRGPGIQTLESRQRILNWLEEAYGKHPGLDSLQSIIEQDSDGSLIQSDGAVDNAVLKYIELRNANRLFSEAFINRIEYRVLFSQLDRADAVDTALTVLTKENKKSRDQGAFSVSDANSGLGQLAELVVTMNYSGDLDDSQRKVTADSKGLLSDLSARVDRELQSLLSERKLDRRGFSKLERNRVLVEVVEGEDPRFAIVKVSIFNKGESPETARPALVLNVPYDISASVAAEARRARLAEEDSARNNTDINAASSTGESTVADGPLSAQIGAGMQSSDSSWTGAIGSVQQRVQVEPGEVLAQVGAGDTQGGLTESQIQEIRERIAAFQVDAAIGASAKTVLMLGESDSDSSQAGSRRQKAFEAIERSRQNRGGESAQPRFSGPSSPIGSADKAASQRLSSPGPSGTPRAGKR